MSAPLEQRASLRFDTLKRSSLARSAGNIVRRSALPIFAGVTANYITLFAYMSEGEVYFNHPQGGVASRVLGIAAAGLLILFLLHSVVMVRVAEGILGIRTGERALLGVRQREWRVYTANLRFAILISLCALVFFALRFIASRLGLPTVAGTYLGIGLDVGFVVLLFWLTARIWMFLAPIGACMDREDIMMNAWHTSSGRVVKTIALLLLALASAYFTQMIVGMLCYFAGWITPLPWTASLREYMTFYYKNQMIMILLINIGYFTFVIVAAVAGVSLLPTGSVSSISPNEC